MSNKKATKRALLTSILAICLCLVMLIGSTFAWFTDTASTSVNQIQSGTLKVGLQMKDNEDQWVDAEGETLQFKVNGKIPTEGTKILWEPGCTYELPALRVVNKGNLALKYKISITGLTGDAKLLEAIDFTVSVVEPGLTPLPAGEGEATAATPTTAKDLNNFEGTLLAGEKTGVITITGKMRADAGNEYQNLSIDSIGITVLATQLASEFDSINNTYDTDATYLNTEKDEDGNVTAYLVGTADELVYFAKTVNVDGEKYSGVTIKLTDDINLSGRNWTPFGTAAKPFVSTFDGNGHTISDLTVNAREAAGLFGRMYGKVQNLTVTDATVTGNHWAGVIAGYSTANGMTIDSCTVTNSTVSIAPELVDSKYDNGDKAGGIIGYCVYGDTVTNCTVEDCTIKGYRDIGGIVGCAMGDKETKTNITNNTVNNVTLIQDSTNGYEAGEITTVGDIVGRYNDLTDTTGSTADGVTRQTVKPISGQEELNEAINGAAAGTTIAIPANLDVTLDEKATIKEGVTLAGVGKDETTLNVEKFNVKEDNVTLKDMTIKGKAPAGNDGALRIGGDNTVIDNVKFIGQGFNGDTKGISVTGANTTIKNAHISHAFRGIIFWDNIGGDNVIENCIIEDVIYTFNINAKTVEPGTTLTVKDSTLNGWTSYSGCMTRVSFDNCQLGKSNGYAYLVAYADSDFTDCVFNDGYQVAAGATGKNLTFTNCKLGDNTLITAENFAEKLGDVDDAMKACTVVVNGTTVSWN